jgi:hypothetical protein
MQRERVHIDLHHKGSRSNAKGNANTRSKEVVSTKIVMNVAHVNALSIDLDNCIFSPRIDPVLFDVPPFVERQTTLPDGLFLEAICSR